MESGTGGGDGWGGGGDGGKKADNYLNNNKILKNVKKETQVLRVKISIYVGKLLWYSAGQTMVIN